MCLTTYVGGYTRGEVRQAGGVGALLCGLRMTLKGFSSVLFNLPARNCNIDGMETNLH